MTKEELALEVIDRLKKDIRMRVVRWTTIRREAAGQCPSGGACTDARVNVVVKGLFEKYPNVAALADAPVEDIEAIVKPCGLGHARRGTSAPV